jgi:hypothetical protein
MSLAIGLTAMAGWLAVRLSQAYYAVAPYHYDSASYRLGAIQFHKLLESEGLAAALLQSLGVHDNLDIILRVLFLKDFLVHPYGHLAVLLPLMCIFLLLVIWYVFSRTQSLLLGIAVIAFLFTFPMIYNPYMGIADNWKDNLATWLLGSAVITFLLSDTLGRRGYSLFSGFFLALLAMQRTVAAFYGGMLFLPPLLWVGRRRIHLDGVKGGLTKVSFFALPPALLAGFLAIIQGQELYRHYFVIGYDYGTPKLVALALLRHIPYRLGLALIVLPGMYLLCLMIFSHSKQAHRDALVGSWFMCGLPLAVVMTSGFYHGFYSLWSVLLVIPLATVVPRTLTIPKRRAFAVMMLTVALVSSVAQYRISSNEAQILAMRNAPWRRVYHQIADLIVAQPPPRKYALFFDEVGAPFWTQAFFDRGTLLDYPAAFMSVHDSYYRATFGGLTARQIVDTNVRNLEQATGTLAIAYCEPSDSLKQPNFVAKRNPLAAEIAMVTSDYLLQSLHWRAIRKLDSPYGCLYAYQYSSRALIQTGKWRDLRVHNH